MKSPPLAKRAWIGVEAAVIGSWRDLKIIVGLRELSDLKLNSDSRGRCLSY